MKGGLIKGSDKSGDKIEAKKSPLISGLGINLMSGGT